MEGLFFLPATTVDKSALEKAPVYFFVNPVEYHGPHLSHYTDFTISRGLARRLHARLCQAVGDHPYIEGPILHLGVDPAPGPGSVQTSYNELRKHILRACQSLVEMGAKKVIFMTFHGAPLHNLAIHKGVSFLRAHGVRAFSSLNLVLEELLNYDASAFAPLEGILDHQWPGREKEVREALAILNADFHGGLFETSLCMELAPESVASNYASVPACPPLVAPSMFKILLRLAQILKFKRLSGEMVFAGQAMAWMALRPFPGYTGVPGLACQKAGHYLVEKRILPLYERTALEALWEGKSAPGPILDWYVYLSLGGRLFSP